MTIDLVGLTGKIITRDAFPYEQSRKMWNRAIEKYPLAIVYCRQEEDIRSGIKWAKEKGIPLRIRSGGHHYEGYSTGNDALVLDLSEFNQIELDEKNETVTIEGGVRNYELYELLGSKHYPFPGGGCPTVGVVGFTLGGGWGYSSRYLGLGCDSLKSVELINSEGELICASETENADLFWALRGAGGGQFGVVVRMTFKLPKPVKKATLIRLDYREITREEQLKLFAIWETQLKELPETVNFKLSFYHSKEKGKGVLLIGMLYGTAEEARKILGPFLEAGEQVEQLIKEMTVWKVNKWIQDAHPEYEHYKSTGRFVMKEFTRAEKEALLNLIENRCKGSVYTAISCYGLGGQVKEVASDQTAFYYRKAQYILGFQTVWEDNAFAPCNRGWLLERFETIKTLTEGSFVSFPCGQLEDYEAAYYGEHMARLRTIKAKYDETNQFAFKQSIEKLSTYKS